MQSHMRKQVNKAVNIEILTVSTPKIFLYNCIITIM
jgi:hypothetical protein